MRSKFKWSSVALMVAGCLATLTYAADRRPNIVLLAADDLGYSDTGVYGSKEIPTPNIDALAKGGIRFTSGYASGPVCSPSRAGLITGRYQARFGFDANAESVAVEGRAPKALDIKQVTLAQRLKSMGYVTGIFGKWHLGAGEGYLPNDRGFDEFYGFLPFGIGSGAPAGPAMYRNKAVVDAPKNHMEQFAKEALSFIDRNEKQPFLLYLPFSAVHAPFLGIEPFASKFENIKPTRRRKYASDLNQLDDVIGRVIQKLREKGLEENTLIFFYSDNGGTGVASRNEPLRGTKWTLWEGGIRVPFVISWKGRLPAGKVIDAPVIQTDIFPTAVTAAGGEIAGDWKLDGVNLLPFLEGKVTEAPHKQIYWRFGIQYAIRQGDWKLVKAHIDSAPLLFNLASDLTEKNDLAASHPEKVKELQSHWDAWNAENEPPRWIDERWNGDGDKKKDAKPDAAGAE